MCIGIHDKQCMNSNLAKMDLNREREKRGI